MEAINNIKKYTYTISTLNLIILKLLFLLIIFIIIVNHNIVDCAAIPNYTKTSLASLKQMVCLMTQEEVEVLNMQLDQLDQELERAKSNIGWESVALYVAIIVSIYLLVRYGDNILLDLGRAFRVNVVELTLLQDSIEAASRKIHSIIHKHGVDTIPHMTRIANEIIANRVPVPPHA